LTERPHYSLSFFVIIAKQKLQTHHFTLRPQTTTMHLLQNAIFNQIKPSTQIETLLYLQTKESCFQTTTGFTQTMGTVAETMRSVTQTMEGFIQTMKSFSQTMEDVAQTMEGYTQTMSLSSKQWKVSPKQ
jgi:hypothetical protein